MLWIEARRERSIPPCIDIEPRRFSVLFTGGSVSYIVRAFAWKSSPRNLPCSHRNWYNVYVEIHTDPLAMPLPQNEAFWVWHSDAKQPENQ